MPLPGSWVELHAALTHFPIALLLVALFFDAGGLVLRRAGWRDIGLAILVLAVISMPFALLSGYLAGRDMGRPPVGFDEHWKASVATTIVSALLLLWRVRTRTRTERAPQFAMMGVALAGAVAVGYTGHMGGSMVHGGRSAPSSEPPPALAASDPAVGAPAPSDKKAADKIALAAGRMSSALERMGTATDALAKRAASQPKASPASGERAAPVLPPAPLDDAAQKLEQVAARFEARAAKIEASVRRLEGRVDTRMAAAPPASAAPIAPGKTRIVAQASARPSTRPSTQAAVSTVAPAHTPTPATAAVPVLVADPRVARGKVVYADEENDCAGCHKINGEGGRSGPDLTFAGRLHPDIEWQIAHLKDPASRVPGSKMPAYADLPQADLEALAAYMVSLK